MKIMYVIAEPSQLIYHNVVNTPSKITIKLVNNNNKTIKFEDCDLFVELSIKKNKKYKVFLWN